MFKETENYIISIATTLEGEPILTVGRYGGSTLMLVNAFIGKDAEEVYEKLINKKFERENSGNE